MGRKKGPAVVKHTTNGHSEPKKKAAGPSAALRKIYDERQDLPTGETLQRLKAVLAGLIGTELDPWKFNPVDTEMIWLILGELCSKEHINEEHLMQIARLLERKKLYKNFAICCSYIIDLDVENSGKKLKLEFLLTALCHTTFLFLTVTTNASAVIRPNFFLDLINSTRNPSVQTLKISSRVMQMLETTHEMFNGYSLQDDFIEEAAVIQNTPEAYQELEQAISTVNETTFFDIELPDNIRNWNIVPTQLDVENTEEVFLRPNVIRHPYPDLETYQDIQFRLLKEDCMHPIRHSLAKLRSGRFGPRDIQGLRAYENVTFWRGGLLMNPRFVPERETSWRLHNIKFQPLPKVNWTTSRRLIHGSLIFLWDGGVELIVATVANSNPDDLASGRLTIALEEQNLSLNFLEKIYMMLESVVFFEPYRAVLQVLQDFTYDNFPMIEYFLGWEKNPVAPNYLEDAVLPYTVKNTAGVVSTMFDSLILSSWPSAQELGLDNRQHQAFCTALTSRVALIQGPPGTGKTFLALKIVDCLLENKQLWQGKGGQSENEKLLSRLRSVNSSESSINWRLKNKTFWKFQGENWRDERTPIVVICFTNHALDQFLEGILKTTNRVIRIGGQSKSPDLEDYNLNAVKLKARDNHMIRPYTESSYFHYFYRMKEVRAIMEVSVRSIQAKIRNLYAENLKIDDLKKRGIITPDIAALFEEKERYLTKRKGKKVNVLKNWLGWDSHRQLLKVLRQARLSVHSQSASVGFTPLIEEDENEKPDEYCPEEEVLDREADLIDDVVDDEYFDEELPQAMGQGDEIVHDSKDDYEDDNETIPVRLACPEQVDNDERELIDFANNQLQRMQLIRDQLLTMPSSDDELMAVLFLEPEEMLSIPLYLRWLLFVHWKKCWQKNVSQDLRDAEADYESKIQEYNHLKGLALASLCRTADVIGLTTTGAAKNRLLLESLNAKIVIVEEAAEVLESHIVCSLTNECQQLIMIGDHQQLRPSVSSHHLAKDYLLDISLFERLVVGGMKAVRLGVQHRMRAEIARLIVPAIYQHLENHPSVYDHPHVPGMQHDVFFYNHNFMEKTEGDSYSNVHEAAMALQLAVYLCREQGMNPEQITILATYTAQMHAITDVRRRNSKLKMLEKVRITVVDNFQGEENDVIILSLVRNNNRGAVGFLRTPNRVCVALSRARNGLYILGNMDLLSKAHPLWAQIEQTLTDNGQLGDGFMLRCDRHHQSSRIVKRLEEFPLGSFCRETCGLPLSCGHLCRLGCHKTGPHLTRCLELVVKELNCSHQHPMPCHEDIRRFSCTENVMLTKHCGHLVKAICGKSAAVMSLPCEVLVTKRLLCNHISKQYCHVPLDKAVCTVEVLQTLPCSHMAKIPCGLPTNKRNNLQNYCRELVKKPLMCGHSKFVKCCIDPIKDPVECGLLMERILDCGHQLDYVCQGNVSMEDIFIPCATLVDHRLACGHNQQRLCSKPIEPCSHEVERKLSCGHIAKTPCWVKRVSCMTMVMKELKCKHFQMVPCGEDEIEKVLCMTQVEVPLPICSHPQMVPCPVSRDPKALLAVKCTMEPLKMLKCNHERPVLCSQNVDEVVCELLVNVTQQCGHTIIARCGSEFPLESSQKCKARCNAPLNCQHFCSLSCHDETVRHVCQQVVEKQLGCGHFQEMPCCRNPAHASCFTNVTMTRACGHLWNGACSDLSTNSEIPCDVRLEKKLPCGHSQLVECSVPIESIFCHVPEEQVLGCRHSVATQCGVPIEKRLKFVCKEEVVKELPCSHSISLPCGSKEANKPLGNIYCRIQVEKKIPQCNHSVVVDCGKKKLTRADCTSPCAKMLNCDHPCQLRCSEPCDTQLCTYPIELEGVTLACEHKLCGECHLRYADEEVLEAKKLDNNLCTSSCSTRLNCNHRCSSKSCRDCVSDQFHSMCNQSCKRELVCNHKCEAPCGVICPPCKAPCEYRCSHQKCSNLCGEECMPCKRPCEWICPHSRCQHACSDLCNREACNLPCMKTLRCGHKCIGLCGEICPPKCPACLRIKIPNFSKDSRYIYLECSCFVEVEEMDQWMSPLSDLTVEADVVKVQCPSCPQCGQPIRLSFRYGDQIKTFHEDLISIKFDIGTDDASLYEKKQDKIRRELVKMMPMMKDCGLDASMDQILSQAESSRLPKRDQRWNIMYRTYLAYRLCCLVFDTKKNYVYGIERRDKSNCNIKESDQASILAGVFVALNASIKNPGARYCLDLLDYCRLLDLQRQAFVIEAITERIPSTVRVDQRMLSKVEDILTGLTVQSKLTEDEERYLISWFDNKSIFFHVNMSSSAKKEIQLMQRLDMTAGSWLKCPQPSCETIFPKQRSIRCPEC